MDMTMKQIQDIGILPVIEIQAVKNAEPLANALRNGGLNCAEVTFRTAAASDSIKVMTERFPDMLVGAGTILTTAQAEQAVQAGARFIVSPGLNPHVVKYCLSHQIPVIPGCATPTEVGQAIELGLDVIKFFPAEAAGGLAMIKSLAAPYPHIKFMPTGGITADNLHEYLDFDRVIACGGSFMVKPDMIAGGEFDKITALTKEAVTAMLGLKLRHVGINTADDGEARAVTADFSAILGTDIRELPVSFFTGTEFEIMKGPGRGTKGHIAIGTNYLDRAVYHLKSRGYTFDHESAVYDEKGKLTLIYITPEIGGFAVHLSQNK